MALFQTSVLNKYLAEQDKDLLFAQYNIFKSYFLNPTIQNNIIAQKEEQFQEGFLRELFVKVLGYTINPEPDFNLTTELKNIKDAKKADGAIINKEKVLAVIELKGTDTTNLTKIEQQAFNYKNNQDGCRYVITSNFQKLRFYIDNAIEFIEWDLFKLDIEGFCLMYLCLAKTNIFNDLPAKIKTESVTVEEQVTKQLYKEYSQFRKSLFTNIVELNTNYNKLELFKKTQKLLDRFLFLFFAEDRLLVPPNSVRMILDQWTELKEKFDEYQPLYDRFKKYFGYLNTGYIGKQHEIFAYNGGLFAPDDILDSIKIDDAILYNATLGLSNYDYNSEVDVNILGHIFEHSLTEIEELEKEIISTDVVETKTTKRKKDGVFYTPKYITKYIVENTVGTLCKNKKEELNLQEEDYHKLTKKAKKQLYDNLMQYREWLLHITIIDPACGSGAFLNQALEFLIAEHRWIAELEANIFNAPIVFDVESSILENNLFGVDINEESVEIAKLSLWLRTARKGRKLNSLNNNIKCGNSLIDDPNVAGDKAFNWKKEFPQIFKTKELEAFHVVLTTHNSRTSQRMIKYGVEKGDPVELDSKQEIELTKIVGEIIKEKNYQCIAYNICKDHVHLIIVCEKSELSEIIKNIKGKSSFIYQSNGFKPIGKSLWSQKFFRANLDVWQLAELSNLPGYIYKDTYLDKAINYIIHNREKHNLPHLPELETLIKKFVTSPDEAFQQQSAGGFDVVIGNPPYVRQELFKDIKPFLEKEFTCYNSIADLYTYFIEKGIRILKPNGYFSYILPNKFIKATYGIEIRNTIKNNISINLIYDFDDYPVFADATTYPIIFIFSKNGKQEDFIFSQINREVKLEPITELLNKHTIIPKENLKNNEWKFSDSKNEEILAKMNNQSITLSDLVDDKIFRGVSTGKNEVFIINEEQKNKLSNNPYRVRKIVTGKEVKRNSLEFQNQYLLFIDWDYNIEEEITLKEYLLSHKNILSERPEVKEGRFNWWCLSRYGSKNVEFLFKPKIIYPRINSNCNFYLDEDGDMSLSDNNFFISSNSKSLLALLNSKLIFYYLKQICTTLQGGYFDFRRPYIEKIPIHKKLVEFDNPLSRLSNSQLTKNKELQQASSNFQKLLTSKYSTLNINTKLEKWYELSFADFNKELTKQKIQLSLSEQSEWLTFFELEKQKALAIKNEIDKTDKEIDQMVYQLYGLTEEEIKIVEGN